MCTVILLVGVSPEHPLIVAANRDELLARPWSPPAMIADGVLAPRDDVAGGTWMGATVNGFFAALTNIHVPGRAPRSRGEIVLEVLRAGSIDAATTWLRGLTPTDYAPFNLLYGGAAGVRLCRSISGAVTFEELEPGLRVLPNGPLDAPLVPKVQRARELIGAHVTRPWTELLPVLRGALADHEGAEALSAICVHRDPFGTSSSMILALDEGRTAAYLFAPGPPCVTAFRDLSAFVDA